MLFREIIGIYRRIILNTSVNILCRKMKGFLILTQKVHTISTGIYIVNVKKPYSTSDMYIILSQMEYILHLDPYRPAI